MYKYIILISIYFSSILMGQEYVTLKDFYEQLGDAKNFIKMTTISENENQVMIAQNIKNEGNQKYIFNTNEYFTTDTDALLKYTNSSPLIDARINLFKSYAYHSKSASKTYPYSILTYWDILPHPPIPKLDKSKNYYTNTYIDENINQNSELLSRKFQMGLDDLTESILTTGNMVRPMYNGQLYSELIKQLLQTKKFLLASNMFMACDESLSSLRTLMRKKIGEGVEISMITEGTFAILKYRKCYNELKEMGVKITYSMGLFNFLRPSKKYVYHDKFWIFDNNSAVVFGHNLLDVGVESNGFNQKYRDTGVLVKGPIVHQLSKGFLNLHQYMHKNKIQKHLENVNNLVKQSIKEDEFQNKILTADNYPEHVPNGSCRIVFQGPHLKNKQAINNLYNALFDAAKNNIFVSSVRLPTELDFKNNAVTSGLVSKLFKKSLDNKNFQVDIMTNNWMGATDVPSKNYKNSGFMTSLYKLFTKANSQSTNEQNLNGVRNYLGGSDRMKNFNVWTYFNYYHSKTLMVDNTLGVIGSYNLNKNSTDRSFEMSLVCNDVEQMKSMQSSVILDMINSVPLLD